MNRLNTPLVDPFWYEQDHADDITAARGSALVSSEMSDDRGSMECQSQPTIQRIDPPTYSDHLVVGKSGVQQAGHGFTANDTLHRQRAKLITNDDQEKLAQPKSFLDLPGGKLRSA